MTARDPEQQREDDNLARAFAGHLQGRLAPTLDPATVAADLIAIARDHDWRHVPRPEPITAAGARDPQTAARGAAYARDLLDRTRKDNR